MPGSRTPLFARSQPGGVFDYANVARTPRNVWFLDSAAAGGGDTVGHGGNPDKPFLTLSYAFSSDLMGAGDVLYVMPGHGETIGNASQVLDIAGVKVIGLGSGLYDMPRFRMNHANAEISVAADGIVIQGLRFTADVTSVAVCIEIEDGSDDVVVRGNVFDVETTVTDEFLVTIRTNDASNRAVIEDNDIDMGLGGAVAAISFTKDTDGTVVRKNRIQGDYSTACINGLTTLSSKLLIEDNLLQNGNGSNIGTEPAIELLTGSYGVIARNNIVCNLATKAASIVADTCLLFDNLYNEDVTGTGGIIGTASADD